VTAAEVLNQRAFVLLQIGERRYALSAEAVAELAPPVKLHTFPHTSPSISGVIVRRGHVVPVYDAGPMLMGKSSAAQRFYLIARRRIGKTAEFSAIPVNGECELANADLQPPPAEHPAYVSGTLRIGEESVEVLDLNALLASNPSATHSQAEAERSS
jgi:chemotaxis signal transduction protein